DGCTNNSAAIRKPKGEMVLRAVLPLGRPRLPSCRSWKPVTWVVRYLLRSKRCAYENRPSHDQTEKALRMMARATSNCVLIRIRIGRNVLDRYRVEQMDGTECGND